MFDFIIAERKSKCKLIIRHYLNIVAAMARTVELAEVHALPDAEEGLAVLDEHGLARADIAALEVRGRIALSMPKLPPVGKRLAQTEQQIVLHIRVGVSLMVIPAVVCGQYTTARPLCTPLSRMTSRSLAVILYMPS